MRTTTTSTIADAGLLGLRGVVGGYLAAHGAQKLFGAFGGEGSEATAEQFEEHLELQPGPQMATLAGGAELIGGVLTTAGLGGPLGPMAIIGTMGVASATAHRDNGPFNTDGGPELPLTNIAACLALIATGPGRFSLDHILRVRTPKALIALALVGGTAAATYTLRKPLADELASSTRMPVEDDLAEDTYLRATA
jgi:putative oxidoreductase